MIDLMPPEVPIGNPEPIQQKQSFFQKLFSKKQVQQSAPISAPITMNDLPNMDLSNNSLPDLPPLDIPDAKPDLKSLDWSLPISDQQDVIAHSNRNNPDIDNLISKAKQQVEEEQKILSLQSALTTTGPAEQVSPNPIIPDSHTELVQESEEERLKHIQESLPDTDNIVSDMPAVSQDQQQDFTKLDKDHESLRNKLEKKMQKPSISNSELKELFKQYDEKIESKIERKQLEFNMKSQKINKLHELLLKQERQLKSGHANLVKFDGQLKKKQEMINEIITNNVNKQLAKRTSKEKSLLKREISRTIILNKSLKAKLDTIENDRIAFDKKKAEILRKEHVKLNAAQSFYEKKLAELDAERKALDNDRRALDNDRKEFEQKKSQSIELLKKADAVSGQLNQIQQLKEFVSRNSTKMAKDLEEDKELKNAIDYAEKKLGTDKADLDNMVLSKYITSKLQSINPEPVETGFSQQARQIYDQIKQCKDKLLKHDIEGAKSGYNDIKKAFETSKFRQVEKSMLYNSIRALYSEIQLNLVESKMHA